MNMEATIPCLLFFQQKCSVREATYCVNCCTVLLKTA